MVFMTLNWWIIIYISFQYLSLVTELNTTWRLDGYEIFTFSQIFQYVINNMYKTVPQKRSKVIYVRVFK